VSDLELRPVFCTVTDDDGARVVAFAASDDPEDGYVFVQQDMTAPAAPLYLEVSDEIFGAHDALQGVTFTDDLITLVLKPEMVMRFGAVAQVLIYKAPDSLGWDEAATALRAMVVV
jgi:hypothetical protein